MINHEYHHPDVQKVATFHFLFHSRSLRKLHRNHQSLPSLTQLVRGIAMVVLWAMSIQKFLKYSDKCSFPKLPHKKPAEAGFFTLFTD